VIARVPRRLEPSADALAAERDAAPAKTWTQVLLAQLAREHGGSDKLATRVGLSRPSIQAFRLGTNRNPTLQTIRALEQVGITYFDWVTPCTKPRRIIH
jgi:transcriptional regulator with XRE-family HTH domain